MNFAMNVADRKDIHNLFQWLYAEEVIELQRENAQLQAEGKPLRPIPPFRDWAQGKYRDRVGYAKYFDDSLSYQDLNPPPLTFEDWVKIPAKERPRAKLPAPE